jgi:hypothetical protein
MKLLFDVGSDLLISLLGEWSEVNTVGYFDSALCNIENREVFLKCLLKYNKLLFHGPPQHITSEKFVVWVGLRHIFLRSLNLNNKVISSNNQNVKESLLRIARTLKEVSFEYCTLENTRRMKDFISHLWEVKYLSLTNSRFVDRRFLDNVCSPNLENLIMNETFMCGETELISSEIFSKLTEIQLSGVRVTGIEIGHLFENNKILQVLDISRNYDMDDLNSDKLASCENLTSLNVSGQTGFENYGYKRIIENCTKITDLNLSDCCLHGKCVINCLTKSKLILKKLDISSTICDVKYLILLFEAQTSIQYLGMSKIHGATLELFEFIVQTLSLIHITFRRLKLSYSQLYNIICAGFSHIQVFDLIDCVVIGTPAVRPVCTSFRGTFVKHIIMEHPEIQQLGGINIEDCFNVDNLHSIFEGELIFSSLTSLKINQLRPSDVLLKLSGKLSTLTCLSFRECSHISDSKVRTLLMANKGLKSFKCVHSRDLTDNVMYTLMYNCKGLRSFTMTGSNTTYTGLVKMVKRLHFLTCIDFDCIDNIDEKHEFSCDEVISFGNVVNNVNIQLQHAVIDLTSD